VRNTLQPDRVALVHDRLEQNGGAERVLWALHEMFPAAPIFTAMWNEAAVPRFKECDIRTSWMQNLPGIHRMPRAFAALYPVAFDVMKLEDFDLVISTTSSFAQGIHTNGALHLCYCHSPANFVWRPQAYFPSLAARTAAIPLRLWLKAWDRHAAANPDIYIATGRPVADRIEAFYGRSSAIIHPPIERKWFTPHVSDGFLLFVGRLVPHKRAELAIEACAELGLPLVVAGGGRSAGRLRVAARGETQFLGQVSDEELRMLYARARAVLVPSEEEFGLVSLEAQAAGTPVIAYDAGGARETVVDGVTGIRFSPQTAAGLAAGIGRFQEHDWDREAIQANAARFSQERFERELLELVERNLGNPSHTLHTAVGQNHA
jgi:glycosyltransferase involved in cell wall biosynthesis